MKPTSVIFLIVSVLLACLGVVLCMTATSIANEQGIGLFTQVGDGDDNYIHYETFTEEELKKVVIKVSDVKVNVIGNAEESKIELVNFPNNAYQIQAGRSTLQISDNAGISGIIDLENLKINFNGFRDYLHYVFEDSVKEKSLNLYLTENADLVNFNITTTTGDISVSNFNTDCDFKIVITDGVVDFRDVITESSVQIEATESSNINIDNVNADEIRIMSPNSECFVDITDTTFTRAMYIEVKSGDVYYDRVESDFANLDVKLEAPGNTISVYGEKYSDSYTEFNAPLKGDQTQPSTDHETEATTAPNEQESSPGQSDGEETTAAEETTSEPEDIGDIEDEEENNTSVSIPANSLTVIIAEGSIEIK